MYISMSVSVAMCLARLVCSQSLGRVVQPDVYDVSERPRSTSRPSKREHYVQVNCVKCIVIGVIKCVVIGVIKCVVIGVIKCVIIGVLKCVVIGVIMIDREHR